MNKDMAQGACLSPHYPKNVMSHIKPLEILVFGVYIVFILLGFIFLAWGLELFALPEQPMTINSYMLALLSLGFSFMIALLCYNKFRVNFNFGSVKSWSANDK